MAHRRCDLPDFRPDVGRLDVIATRVADASIDERVAASSAHDEIVEAAKSATQYQGKAGSAGAKGKDDRREKMPDLQRDVHEYQERGTWRGFRLRAVWSICLGRGRRKKA